MHIFFSDLDGTLLNDQKEITPLTKKAVDDFVAAGNHFVISTGRPLQSAIDTQKRLGLKYPGSYVSAYNGAVIYDTAAGKTLYETGIALDLIKPMLEIADSCHVHIQAFQKHYIVSRSYNDHLQYYRDRISMPVIITEDMLSELAAPPWKLLAIDIYDRAHLEEFHDTLSERLGNYVRPVFSGPHYIDIFPVDAGKGKSLVRLCQLLHVPVENSFAAGDEENDIPMLEAAGCGICMCNGNDETKRAADVITTEDNNHDGLVPFLKSAVSGLQP